MVDSGSILGVEPTDFLMWGKSFEEENQEFGSGHVSSRYPIRLQVGVSREAVEYRSLGFRENVQAGVISLRITRM